MTKAPDEEKQAIAKIREFVGDTFSFKVEADHVVTVDFSGGRSTRESIAELSRLTHLKILRFGHCRDLREGDLQPLQQLTSLEGLSVYVTPVSDNSLKYIGKLKKLLFPRLYSEPRHGERETTNSQPTDKGLAELTGLAKLDSLQLFGDQITDAGLIHLRVLKGLREVHLFQTSTTVSGLVEFTSTSASPRSFSILRV